jgi:hypothetical protein
MGLLSWLTEPSRPSTTVSTNADGTFTETRSDGSTRQLRQNRAGKFEEVPELQLVDEENLTQAERDARANEDAKDGRPLVEQTRTPVGKSANDETGKTSSPPPPPFNWADAPKPSTAVQEPGLETLNASQRNRIQSSGPSVAEVFSINSFRAEMLENEVLPSHTYLVTFAPFRDVQSPGGGSSKENAPLTNFVTNKRNTLVMRCENIVRSERSQLGYINISTNLNVVVIKVSVDGGDNGVKVCIDLGRLRKRRCPEVHRSRC